MSESTWKRCSSCKSDIAFGQLYWACNVSTCNGKRTGFHFCSVECWDAHVPTMRHRDAWAVEKRAPTALEHAEEERADAATARSAPATVSTSPAEPPRRRIVNQGLDAAPDHDEDETFELRDDLPRDILVVVSKLKKYIKARSGMNTSDSVMAPLSAHIRAIADQAIRSAAQNERKTVLDRDLPPIPRR